jgi:hypothetical protein
MAKTLLQLINEVGKNVRRSLGSTYTASNFDSLHDPVVMTQFINMAKAEVEDAWDWERLITRVAFTTVANQHEYDTTLGGAELTAGSTNDRSRILRRKPDQALEFWRVESGRQERMRWMDSGQARQLKETETDAVQRPLHVSAYQNGDGLTILFPFAPAGALPYAFNAIVPQDDLSADSDTLTVPWRPVVLRATTLALAERGEELGINLDLIERQYDSAISHAIGQEMGLEDTLFIPD